MEISAENGNAEPEPDAGAVAPLRRSSARLQKMRNQKLTVEVSAKNNSGTNRIEKESGVSRKNTGRVYKKRKVETPHHTVLLQNGAIGEASEARELVNGGNTITSTNCALVGKSSHTMVTETLRTFNKYYLHFIQKKCIAADDTKRGSKRPDLKAITKVYFTRGRIPNSISEIRGLVCEDITGGQEDIPIPVTNLVDDPPIPPKGVSRWCFLYSFYAKSTRRGIRLKKVKYDTSYTLAKWDKERALVEA
ncbi:unnamed protein product [Fraxinus pennsylvanica]|uniref:Uncharacterized protein n=1 Tax=Fraxinus pennsylvanica TaxID=56036 RepID=A0AAD1YQT2_9LAMI|nr:unnamed protein product [Fraxinus pennsylvanica]